MYRTVIEYKRNPHSSSFDDCIGIIAYANTFTELCKEELGAEAGQVEEERRVFRLSRVALTHGIGSSAIRYRENG